MPIDEVQITNKQHAVPQNFMDVEFKLVGDLTMRQFTYLAVFGLLAYIASLTVVGIFKWPFVIFLALMGLFLAFVPVEERGMDQWIINFIKAVYSPTQKVWKKSPVLPSAFLYQNIAVMQQEMITLTPTSSRRRLEEYLEHQSVDEQIDRLDIPEKEFILKVKEAYASMPVVTAPPEVLEPLTLMPTPEISEFTEEPFERPVEQPAVPEEPEKPKDTKAPAELPQEQEVPKEFVPPAEITLPRARYADITLSPMTPDRHIGRRFMHLLPKQGEITLPVRGEKLLKTSEEIKIEGDIQEKAEKLRKLVESIKRQESGNRHIPQVSQPAAQEASEAGQEVTEEAQSLIENIRQENAKLTAEIERLKSEVEASRQNDQERQRKEEELRKLQQVKTQSSEKYSSLQQQFTELQSKLEEAGQVVTTPSSEVTSAPIPITTDKPNVISGIVRDPQGAGIEGTLIIIKDSKKEPKRALKTNALGQFSLSNPLGNGAYTVEVGLCPVKDLHFDIISLEARGKIIPPIEIAGKR